MTSPGFSGRRLIRNTYQGPSDTMDQQDYLEFLWSGTGGGAKVRNTFA
jgi:hypothetical protein